MATRPLQIALQATQGKGGIWGNLGTDGMFIDIFFRGLSSGKDGKVPSIPCARPPCPVPRVSTRPRQASSPVRKP